MQLNVNDVVVPALSRELVDRAHRVLVIDKDLDALWLIGFPRKERNGKRCTHVCGPLRVSLSLAMTEMDSGGIQRAQAKIPAHYSMTDEDYLRDAGDDIEERERREERQRQRDRNWDYISPLLDSYSTEHLVKSFGTSPSLIAERAQECGVAPTTVYRTLHKYWAGGSVRNALLPRTDLCGGPGKERQQRVRLGRKRRSVNRGESTEEGYILTEKDKERLGRGYSLINATTDDQAAFLTISGAFWSTPEVQEDGTSKPVLWPPHRRPTFAQFRYWGEKRNTREIKRRRVGADRWAKRDTHKGGSTHSQVAAFGQVGVFDSTSTDLYLTSMWDRRKKLTPATRTLELEQLSTAIVGWYVGFEKPSSSVALQAILCGAKSPEAKVEICKRYGVESVPEDWIGALPRRFLADNGELKSERATEAEEQFHFGIEFTKSYSGESKGDVESSHHTFHKQLDHTVEGASPGMRQPARGEDHPAIDALWNFYEYMRHFLQEAVDYQRTEVPERAPTQMLKEGIRPTRVNIARWYIDHGQRADVPCDVEQLRAFTLPNHMAVMERNGIFLKTLDGRRIPKFRYFSTKLRELPVYQDAAINRKAIEIIVKCDKQALSEIWIASSMGLLRVPNVDADAELMDEATEEDMVGYLDNEAVHREKTQHERDQSDLDKLLSRKATSERASAELKQQLKGKKKPPKSEVSKNLRQNAAEEMEKMAAAGAPPPPGEDRPTTRAQPSNSDAAVSAMTEFLKSNG
jgi:hypothetical protein